jgi:hypothetical protein
MSLDDQPRYAYKEKDTDVIHLTHGSRLSCIPADQHEGQSESVSNLNGNTMVSLLPWASTLITLNTISGMRVSAISIALSLFYQHLMLSL